MPTTKLSIVPKTDWLGPIKWLLTTYHYATLNVSIKSSE